MQLLYRARRGLQMVLDQQGYQALVPPACRSGVRPKWQMCQTTVDRPLAGGPASELFRSPIDTRSALAAVFPSGALMNKNRVELFSDGVFAIVLTLLADLRA